MKKQILISSVILLSQFSADAQMRIVNTVGTGSSVTVNAPVAPSSSSVMLGGNTGTTGNENTFIGNSSGTSNQAGGDYNTFIGQQSGNFNKTGQANVFLGYMSGLENTKGNYNTFLGQAAGEKNDSGEYNTFVGQSAGGSNTASNNTFIGQWSGLRNTLGTRNAFLGQNAGYNNTLGNNNTIIGQQITPSTYLTGSNNTYLGQNVGSNTTTGNGNTFLGSSSGNNNIQGNNNIAIGFNAQIATGTWSNAIAIGFNSIASANNSMSLGAPGNTADAVRVGIGTGSPTGVLAPQADLHIYKNLTSGNTGTEILSHWGNTDFQSALTLRTGTSTLNDLFLRMHGTSSTTTMLLNSSTFTGAPALSTTSANLGLIATKASPLMIGINPNNTEAGPSENIYFVNNINTYAGKKAWECMRINKDNGFVGIHTRTSPKSAGTGEPQALFHVNLNNAAKPGFDKEFDGIRFEGLKIDNTNNYLYVLVTDDDKGNIVKRAISTLPGGGGTIDWHVNGNTTVTPFPEFIGTLNDDDFRIKTNGNPRARFTSTTGTAFGNFELGSGSSFLGTTDKSVAFGENNTINNSKDVLTSGKGNAITASTASSSYSGAVGVNNKIDASEAAFAAGNANDINSGSYNSAAFGEVNNINGSSNVLTGGLQNLISGSNATLSSGELNKIIFNSNNSTAVGKSNTISGSAASITSGYLNSVTSNSNNSGALGSENTIVSSEAAHAIGNLNQIQDNASGVNSNYSAAIGYGNKIEGSAKAGAIGSLNQIKDASGQGCVALGTNNNMINTEESVSAGESNTMKYGHGCFIGGGHNNSEGMYNILLGTYLDASTTPMTYPALSPVGEQIMMIGEHINSNLSGSLTVGYQANRTMVVNKRGVAIQMVPNAPFTFAPDHNLVVDAHPTGTVASNIAFVNLPSTTLPLPAVLVDPTTGELFMSNKPYPNPMIVGGDSSESMMIQKLEESVKEQQLQIQSQQKQIDDLMAAVKTLTESKKNEELTKIDIALSSNDAIVLNQNIPNPCDKYTYIGFSIPASVQSATINFSTMDGKMIKSISIKERGKGMINIQTTDLTSGIYLYTLIADGRQIDSKKMEINR
ncbi:MAG: hypothetical protein WC716_15060 [Chitinophagaceae bacterium]